MAVSDVTEPIEFRLFGGIEAQRNGVRVDIGHARQQCVLAVLLIEANAAVSIDELIDRVWAGEAPHRAKDSLYSYLTRLRRALPEITITRRGTGYSLTVDESAIDLHRFRHLIRKAADADDAAADDLLGDALALWRGEPFAGLDTPWLTSIRATLDNQRSAAELDHIDLELRLGRHNEILPRVASLAAVRPLDERLASQLMLALYRAGRQADALTHYEQTRAHLANELGIDPSPALRELHQQILTTDPALNIHAPEPTAQSPIPRQLPAAPRSFTGRVHELDSLTSAMDAEASTGATVVISAIGGTGGIGKTWLALHWAHENVDRFPDGQLFVNLRGFDPTGKPTSPHDAVRGFLDALGVEPSSVPLALDAQTALYRSLVTDKRMLIVLDNAAEPAQVIPLLPGSPSSTVIVTSRDRLASLVNAHGAQPLPLDALGNAEAHALLANRLGADRLSQEPAAVDDLIASCAGLPLALSIVAGRALEHPGFPLSGLAEEIRDTASRLSALDEGPATSVRSVLSWSYAALTDEQARIFGLLGLAPGTDISLAAAANLANLSDNQMHSELRGLERVSLIQQQVPGRFRMHDLVRLYATEQAKSIPEKGRYAALRLLVDFYSHTALAADRQLAPSRRLAELAPPIPGCRPLSMADSTIALAWFNAEYECLSSALSLSIQKSWNEAVWLLAAAPTNFRWRRTYLVDDIAAWQSALTAAKILDNLVLAGSASRRLGHAYSRSGQHEEAFRHLQQSLALCKQTDSLAELGHTHMAMAQSYERYDDYRQALHHTNQALALYQQAPDCTVWAGQARNGSGWFHARLGEYAEARIDCEAALAISRSNHDPEGQADSLDSLGYIAHHAGRYDEAIERYEESVILARTLGHEESLIAILEHLWQSYLAIDDIERARDILNETLQLHKDRQHKTDVERIREKLAELDHLARGE